MDSDENKLIELELRLHSHKVRSSKEALDELIDDEFREIGASGVYFGKKEVLDRLPSEDEIKIEASDFEYRRFSDSIAHLTYKSRIFKPIGTLVRAGYRTSIWKRSGSKWQIIFHQGTIAEL